MKSDYDSWNSLIWIHIAVLGLSIPYLILTLKYLYSFGEQYDKLRRRYEKKKAKLQIHKVEQE